MDSSSIDYARARSVTISDKEIAGLFAVGVKVCISSSEMYNQSIYDIEFAAVANANASRRREFAAGRAAARIALAKLGVAVGPIPKLPDNTPAWPAHTVGSISHCSGFCCAVVAQVLHALSVGFDAELADSLEESLIPIVCSSAEINHFRALPVIKSLDWPKLAFGAKEAFYKCQYPLTHQFLDFGDVEVSFDVDDSGACGQVSFRAPSLPTWYSEATIGRWHFDGERIYVGTTIRAGADLFTI